MSDPAVIHQKEKLRLLTETAALLQTDQRSGKTIAPRIIRPASARTSILIHVFFSFFIQFTSQCLFFMRFLRFGM